jgi:hypothetical protein
VLRSEVVESAQSFAADRANGLGMDAGEARMWATEFAKTHSLDELEVFREAYGLGIGLLGLDAHGAGDFATRMTARGSTYFGGWRSVFEYAAAVRGPRVPARDAREFADRFVREFGVGALSKLKRAHKQVGTRSAPPGIEGLELALDRLRKE